jgi:hypothetical protein
LRATGHTVDADRVTAVPAGGAFVDPDAKSFRKHGDRTRHFCHAWVPSADCCLTRARGCGDETRPGRRPPSFTAATAFCC